jgi:hypothetical protein
MNYTVNGKNYVADDGYVFQSKTTGILSKKLRLSSPDILNNYDIIPEPIPEEPEQEEIAEDGEV